MGDPSSSPALILLGEVYREGRTGVLSVGPENDRVQLAIRDGDVVGIVPSAEASTAPKDAAAPPDDSARLKLERVLAEVGLRARPRRTERTRLPSAEELRERILVALTDPRTDAELDQSGAVPEELTPVEGAEPLLLEAVRRVREADAVRLFLGDIDRRLVATSALATEERTLTLTEGYILSRIDGQLTAREVLQLVPLDPDDAERSLLGLILTGRVKTEARPPRPARRSPTAPPRSEPDAGPTKDEPEHIPLDSPLVDGPPAAAGGDAPAEAAPRDESETQDAVGSPAEEMDTEVLARRREILEVFQALPLRNHFEVLDLHPGCSDEEVRRAHIAHVKRYHPDMQRDARLADLRDVLEAIFIRVGEAWEVLGNAKSRAAYEARLGPQARRSATSAPVPGAAPSEAAAAPEEDLAASLSPEDTLMYAQRLLRAARYWEAIRLLESAMPRLQPQRHEHRGRILLARAYARNPNWVRKAEETLQNVVKEDPANADAYYELGMLFKARAATARAQAMFRRAVELKPDHRGATAEIGEQPPSPGLLSRLFKRSGGP